MADNLSVTPGVGATVRTKETGGIHVQAVTVMDPTGANALAVAGTGAMAFTAADLTTLLNVQTEMLVVLKRLLLVMQSATGAVVAENEVEPSYQ